jgi:hypothetical protein
VSSLPLAVRIPGDFWLYSVRPRAAELSCEITRLLLNSRARRSNCCGRCEVVVDKAGGEWRGEDCRTGRLSSAGFETATRLYDDGLRPKK